MKPTARKTDLEIQTVDDELVVYDLRNDEAHCLHPLAAKVWDLADGTRDVPALVAELGEDVQTDGTPVDEDDVWAALDALSGVGLLEEQPGPPMGERRFSRRDLVRGVAAAGALGLVPGVVGSILAPTPASAQSAPSGGGGEVDSKTSEASQKELDNKATSEQSQKQAEEDLKLDQRQAEAAAKRQAEEDAKRQAEADAKESRTKPSGNN